MDITLPGLPTFDRLFYSMPAVGGGFEGDWSLIALSSSDILAFIFTTQNPSSLVGFTGGLIKNGIDGTLNDSNYSIISGSITPTPEPSSLVLLAGGWLVFGLRRRFAR